MKIVILNGSSPNVYDGAVGEYRGILRYFGAADCGIVMSDNATNKAAPQDRLWHGGE